MHLYGNDMTAETTPFEAGLGWLVHLEMSTQFIGRDILENQSKEGIKKALKGAIEASIFGNKKNHLNFQSFHKVNYLI